MKRSNTFFTIGAGLAVLAFAAAQYLLPGASTPAGAAGESPRAAEGSQSKRSVKNTDVQGDVTVRLFTEDGTLGDPVRIPAKFRSDAEWKKELTPTQYHILREKGTERAFTGALLKNKEDGVYTCAGCNLPLFESSTKFESGTGWPSFYAPIAEENIVDEEDISYGMVRTETLCARCGGHLGHVFNDGPDPTGLRYCMNSEALGFTSKDQLDTLVEEVAVAANDTPARDQTDDTPWLPLPEKDVPLAKEPGEAKAIFAGGCFWCTEGVFEELDGVKAVISGYTGGDPARANYKAVTTGTTGHAEAIEIIYDPSKLTYGQLLRVFFTTHDPTTLNRQGPDTGTQYRSAIFYQDEEEKAHAEAYIAQLNASGKFSKPIVTTLEPLTEFFTAEDYHQDYLKHNPNQPYIQFNAVPKVQKLKKMLEADEKASP